MTDRDDTRALASLLLILTWTISGMALAFGFPLFEGLPYSLAYFLLMVEWLLLGLTGLISSDSDAKEAVQQRRDETNAHHLARVWVTVHVFVLKMPVMAIAGAPGAARRTKAWLRETPRETND